MTSGETPTSQSLFQNIPLQSVAGEVHSLSEYQGQVVIVSFGASWCPLCKLELQSLEYLNRRFHDQGLMTVAILVDDSADAAKKLEAEQHLSYPLFLDTQGDFKEQFQLSALPQSLVLARDGSVRVLASENGRTLAPYPDVEQGMPSPVDWTLPAVVSAVKQLLGE